MDKETQQRLEKIEAAKIPLSKEIVAAYSCGFRYYGETLGQQMANLYQEQKQLTSQVSQ